METNQKPSSAVIWRHSVDKDGVPWISLQGCSKITVVLIKMLIQRDHFGKSKYNTSLDRTDLSKEEWCEHLTEELLDAAGYAQCIKRGMT